MGIIVDGHVHIGDWQNLQYRAPSLSLAELKPLMKKYKIRRAVVMPTDKLSAKEKNSRLLEQLMNESPNLFYFFAWINPWEKDYVHFLEDNVIKVSGVKLHPSLDCFRIGDRVTEPILKYCEENDVPALVHCGRWQKMASSLFALDVAKRHSDLTLILAHMGGSDIPLVLETLEQIKKRALENVYLDTSGCYAPWIISKAVDLLGSKKIVFGSDAPLGHPGVGLSCIRAAGLSKTDEERLLGENLMGVLGRHGS